MLSEFNEKTGQYLTFKLDEEMFALEISAVREVLEFSSVTKIPRTPDFMRGVINLRGNVVPVMDLKLKFGMEKTEKVINTCVIIVETLVGGEEIILGALADSVQEVVDIELAEIEPPPKIGVKLDADFIKGMGKRNDEFIIILDINKVFSDAEFSMVAEMRQQEEPAASAAAAASG